MKLIIKENQRGFLLKHGIFVRMLEPGEHTIWPAFGQSTITTSAKGKVSVDGYEIATLLRDEYFKNSVDYINVPDGHLALQSINGKVIRCLTTGEYYFWNIFEQNTFQLISMEESEEVTGVKREYICLIPTPMYISVTVADGMAGVLYKDGAYQRELVSGTYFFWTLRSKIQVKLVDMRSIQLSLQGQEILTADKVSLRVNFVCTYRITDAVKILNAKQDYQEQIYSMAQLALREHIGKLRLDQLLEEKDHISQRILAYLQQDHQSDFVEFLSAGIKDIILPGEIQDIMNTVLIAEKTAQANVITRREEVASTRSLLNTARLMEENTTLYKLKELEYIEKIADKVNSISLNSSNDMLAQLAGLLVPKDQK